MGVKEKTSKKTKPGSSTEKMRNIILFNDDYNTFDYIIKSLVEVCDHDEIQAENCALVAHYKGKCHIKKGAIDKLRPIYVELTARKITVEIS